MAETMCKGYESVSTTEGLEEVNASSVKEVQEIAALFDRPIKCAIFFELEPNKLVDLRPTMDVLDHIEGSGVLYINKRVSAPNSGMIASAVYSTAGWMPYEKVVKLVGWFLPPHLREQLHDTTKTGITYKDLHYYMGTIRTRDHIPQWNRFPTVEELLDLDRTLS